MFTPNSFKRPSKSELEFMDRWRKRWNPNCKRKNLKEVMIVKERQDNFSFCMLMYPCETRTLYFVGMSKRNPERDEESPEIGWSVALARACRGLFGRMAAPPKKSEKKKEEVAEPTATPHTEDEEFFELNKDCLIEQFPNEYVLIHDGEIDLFSDDLEAVKQGYQKYRTAPFIVKHLVEDEIVAVLDVKEPVVFKGEPEKEDHLTVGTER